MQLQGVREPYLFIAHCLITVAMCLMGLQLSSQEISGGNHGRENTHWGQRVWFMTYGQIQQ